MLNGEQAVGYLRWRKNNHGRSGNDFERGERQREVLIALATKAKTWRGILRLPAAYHAARAHMTTNLTTRQFIALGLALRATRSDAVPGTPLPRGGVSYVECDWDSGRAKWDKAIH